VRLVHTSQPGSLPQGIETRLRTLASRSEASITSCELQLPLLAPITQLSTDFEISFKKHGYLWRKQVLKLQCSHHRKLSCIQVAKLHRASSARCLQCCSVLQEPLHCCLLFHTAHLPSCQLTSQTAALSSF